MNANSHEFERYLEDSSGYRGEAEQVFLPADVDELREERVGHIPGLPQPGRQCDATECPGGPLLFPARAG